MMIGRGLLASPRGRGFFSPFERVHISSVPLIQPKGVKIDETERHGRRISPRDVPAAAISKCDQRVTLISQRP